MAADLLPRKSAPLVLLDDGEGQLAARAAAKLMAFGYTNVELLEGGCAAWKATGGELFSGVNVPSKAFGEFVEHHYGTPRIPPAELLKLQASGRKMVILDSRPWEEYHRMNIPGGIDAPGAELVYRVHDLARSGHARRRELRRPHAQHHRLPVAEERRDEGCRGAEGRHHGLGARRSPVRARLGARGTRAHARGPREGARGGGAGGGALPGEIRASRRR